MLPLFATPHACGNKNDNNNGEGNGAGVDEIGKSGEWPTDLLDEVWSASSKRETGVA